MRKSHRGGPVISISRNYSMIEPLENRQLLSASLVKGVIKVSGTAGADAITVGLKGSKQIRVIQGATSKLFARSKVKTISINAGDGDDTITINSGIKQQVNINGGNGNDTVHGGSGREVINGGAGADMLFGGGGSDWIAGGDGGDQVEGDDGNDYLYGDAGDDTVNGDGGNDVLAGDSEDTLVFSGQPPTNVVGNDHLNGGDGNDWLLGGVRVIYDQNTLQPQSFTSNGADVFTGGAGADVIETGDNDDTITDKESADFVPAQDALHFGGENFVHTHVTLIIKVKKGSHYRNAIVQPHMGFFPDFLAALHTHAAPQGLPTGANLIHYEAPADAGNYSLDDFFKVAGISMDKNHIGRFIPAPGQKMTMLVTHNGRTTSSKAFGSFVPAGNLDPSKGDVIEIRVG